MIYNQSSAFFFHNTEFTMTNKFVSANYYLVVTLSLNTLRGHTLSSYNNTALCFRGQVLQVLLLHALHSYLEGEKKKKKKKNQMAFPYKNVILKLNKRHDIK